MIVISFACAAALVLGGSVAAAAEPDDGLMGHWDFDAGGGGVLSDKSGNNNHGKIHGAQWVKCGKGSALEFDGKDDWVDCGSGRSLDLTGPITLQAWVMPKAANRGEPGIVGKFYESYAITYYGSTYFYVSGGGNHTAGPLKINQWTHVLATFNGTKLAMYINGRESTSKKSKFDEIKHGKNFLMGCIVVNPTSADLALRDTAFFPGLIDSVRVHNRVLSQAEMLHYYNLDAQEKGLKPFDASVLGRFQLEPFVYPHADKAVLSVNFRWVVPLAKETEVFAELIQAGANKPLRSVQITHDERYEAEAEFTLKDLKPGKYEFRVRAEGGEHPPATERAAFQYPPAPLPAAPPPSERTVAPLPPAMTPPAYDLEVSEHGGIRVAVNGKTFRVESSYSYPKGGLNRLSVAPPAQKGEPTWNVKVNKIGDSKYRVTAGGDYYSITRLIERRPSRILVKDTITNKTSGSAGAAEGIDTEGILGIILSNHVNAKGDDGVKVTRLTNPTIFLAKEDVGVGLIALDDLYQIQQGNAFADGLAEIRDEHFGLAKGKSHTIEWAIYPTGSNNYYDFINQVRKDEGINRRVPGAFSFVSRRKVPSPDFVDLKNMAYASVGCLGHPPDDPTVSLEGFEFMEYPKETALLTETFAKTKSAYPGIRVMFHVAHSIYACGNPKERFLDSRAVHKDGSQVSYGTNSWEKYYIQGWFTRERFDQNWRWWIFYPTLENSFGKAMIEAMEFMVDKMGATGMWADGFFSGYVRGNYSYDRWDGHSVTIDPETKLVTEVKNCVPYAALPVLKKVIRIIAAKGGHVVTNGLPGPRSLWNEDYVTSCETGGGDARSVGAIHVGRSVTPLGNPGAIKNERDIYRDILTKLDFGALYFWFGDRDLVSRKTLIEYMYPITFESIHVGTVRGKERIVTKKSGVYGWAGDASLHVVRLHDARGVLTRNDFTTTVDGHGARTEVRFGLDQAAAIVKLPITFAPSTPMNVNVRRYDEGGVRLAVSGKGVAEIRIENGRFPINQGTSYRVRTGDQTRTIAATGKGLAFGANIDGPTDVTVEPAK